MIEEAGQALGLPYTLTSTVRARVFEDNNGALLLATNQRLTNRTKYFLVKWHHFWSKVQDGTIEAKKVSTDLQRADYMTKGLVREIYEKIRKLNQGWQRGTRTLLTSADNVDDHRSS